MKKKTKPTTFSIASSNRKTLMNSFNFRHTDLRENCKSAYDYVFHLTCVMPVRGKTFWTYYISAINKSVKQ